MPKFTPAVQELENTFSERQVGPFVDRGGSVGFDARAYGAVLDGTTNDENALANTIAAAQASGIKAVTVAGGTALVGSALTVPKGVTLRVLEGAQIKPANGVTVTINGAFEAGLYQVFDTSAGGTIAFGPGAVERVLPQWWGAKGDGATDDAAAIQSMIDAIEAAGGGVCYLPPGTYLVGSTIELKDGVTLQGSGIGHVAIKAAPGLIGTVIRNADTTNGNRNIAILDLEVDGNKANRSAPSNANLIHITCASGHANENILIQNVYAHDSAEAADKSGGLGIVLTRVHGGAVLYCHIANTDRDGLTCYFDCQDLRIIGNWIHDVGDDLIGLNAENLNTTGHSMTRIAVIGNVLDGGSSQGSGISVRGVTNSVIRGNIIKDAFQEGIGVSNWNTSGASDLVIEGNVIVGAGVNNSGANGFGIAIVGARSVSSNNGEAGCERIVVANNVIKDARAHGIRILGKSTVDTRFITVSGNLIRCSSLYTSGRGIICDAGPVTDLKLIDNIVLDAQAQGIYLADVTNPLRRVELRGNRVYSSGKSGQAGTPTAPGIYTEAVEDLTLIANVSTDLAGEGSKTTTYGIVVTNPTGTLTVCQNDCNGNGTDRFQFNGESGADRIVGRHNPGFEPWANQSTVPSGNWSTVAVGGQTYYYKDLAVSFGVDFPAGVTPIVTASCAQRGIVAAVEGVSNTGFTIRVWSLRDDSPAANVFWTAQPPP